MKNEKREKPAINFISVVNLGESIKIIQLAGGIEKSAMTTACMDLLVFFLDPGSDRLIIAEENIPSV